MKDEDKPKGQLIKEIDKLNKQNLELKKMETESKRTQNIITGLYNISRVVSSEANLDELFKAIHKHLGTIVDTTNFFIGLYDTKTH